MEVSGLGQIVSTAFKPNHYSVVQVLPKQHAHAEPLDRVVERQLTQAIIGVLRDTRYHSVREADAGYVEVRTDIIVMTEREWLDAMTAQFLKGQRYALGSRPLHG